MVRLTQDEARGLLEDFRRHLRDRRLPVTRQRLVVAEVLFASEDHPSVEDLERRLAARSVRIGTATLYRTLDVLVGSGLVREHDFGEGFKRYEAAAGPAVHEHLVCDRCGRVTEFANDRLERMMRMSADERHFFYRTHRVEVRGLCAQCRSRDLAPLAERPAGGGGGGRGTA